MGKASSTARIGERLFPVGVRISAIWHFTKAVKQAAAQVRIGFRIGSAIERGRIAHLGNTQRRIDRQRDGPRGHIGGGPRLQRARKSADLCFSCW